MKILDQVENILKASHAARNSDKELLIIYMMKFGMGLTSRQIELFKKMPSVETIRRSRQIIQEQGKYPADPEVDKARFEKYKQVKDGIHYVEPEELLEKQGIRVLPWGQ